MKKIKLLYIAFIALMGFNAFSINTLSITPVPGVATNSFIALTNNNIVSAFGTAFTITPVPGVATNSFIALMSNNVVNAITSFTSAPTFSNVSISNLTVTNTSALQGSTTIGTGTVAANTSGLGILRVKQGSSWIDLGEVITGLSGLWMNTTNSTANYFLGSSSSGSSKYVNSPTSLNFAIGSIDKMNINSAGAALTGSLSVSGASTLTGAVYAASTFTINGSFMTNSGATLGGNVSGSSFQATQQVTSSSKTAGIGYAVGSGSTVVQSTSRTTGVTINSITGVITLVSDAGSTTWQSFTVTNSAVGIKDVIIIAQRSGTDLYQIHVTNVNAGSFQVTYATTGGTTNEQPLFSFAVIKGQTN